MQLEMAGSAKSFVANFTVERLLLVSTNSIEKNKSEVSKIIENSANSLIFNATHFFFLELGEVFRKIWKSKNILQLFSKKKKKRVILTQE